METCDTLRSLYVSELRVLFSAEVLLLQAFPSMSEGATTPALQQIFSTQLGRTRLHLSHLERIFKDLSETVSDERCHAMAAMIAEAQQYQSARGDRDVRDAALLSTARKIHHYKAGSYAAICALASRLAETSAATRFATMHDDERVADRELARVAHNSVNLNAGNPAKAKADFDVSLF